MDAVERIINQSKQHANVGRITKTVLADLAFQAVWGIEQANYKSVPATSAQAYKCAQIILVKGSHRKLFPNIKSAATFLASVIADTH